jgi:hypothetical protein
MSAVWVGPGYSAWAPIAQMRINEPSDQYRYCRPVEVKEPTVPEGFEFCDKAQAMRACCKTDGKWGAWKQLGTFHYQGPDSVYRFARPVRCKCEKCDPVAAPGTDRKAFEERLRGVADAFGPPENVFDCRCQPCKVWYFARHGGIDYATLERDVLRAFGGHCVSTAGRYRSVR